VVGISLRRRDQLKPDVVWSVLGNVIQSNARFAITGRLEVYLDHVRMPVGIGGVKTKEPSLDVFSAIKKYSRCKGSLFVFVSCINNCCLG